MTGNRGGTGTGDSEEDAPKRFHGGRLVARALRAPTA